MKTGRLILLVFTAIATLASPAVAQATLGMISGSIVDARNGLPLAGASVKISGPKNVNATTDADGRFIRADLEPGIYRITIDKASYSSVTSSDLVVGPGSIERVTISLATLPTGHTLREIGNVSTTAAGAFTKSSIISKDVSPEQVEQLGYFRAADLLRTLPQVNRASNSETSAPGDDYPFDIRGIGSLETTVLLDGHPIGNGVSGGYNFQVSPVFGLRNIQVAYGSGGSDLSGVDAIGGVIDMQTLEPTRLPQALFTQGFGTFSKLSSTLVGTGTFARTGYAVALGVQSINGPYHQYQYQPGAAFDQSAPAGSPVYNLGVYNLDSTVANRGLVAKIRQQVGSDAKPSHLSATVYDTHYWFDKTGNGDLDYLPHDVALTQGQNLLANYTPPAAKDANPMNPVCPTGTFLASNAQGAPNGFGPDGKPDGGITCQTPQQYANFNTGLQGVGTAWEDFVVSDYHLAYDTSVANNLFVMDLFTNRYAETRSRYFQLPFAAAPGDSGSWNNIQVVTTGAQAVDNISGLHNDFGFGALWFNNAYLFRSKGIAQPSPIDHNQSFFFRELYRANSNLRFFFDGNYKFASITNAWYFDPRFAVVASPTRRDSVRAAYGIASNQPEATYTFLPVSAGGFTSNLVCNGINSVGTGANPSAHPERATDLEAAYGHRFEGDSQVQLTLYAENVFNKLQQELAPLSKTGTAFIDSATLATFEKKFAAGCGAALAPLAYLGLTTNVNLGHVYAHGYDLSGRARVNRQLYTDYDYSESSVELVGAKQNNVPPGQLAYVPIHKASLALDGTLRNGLDLRLTGYFVSLNNPKNSPGYAYADFTAAMPIGRSGIFGFAATNAFGSHAGAFGYINHGLPAPDGSLQELFLLPYSQLYLNYSQKFGGK